MAVNNPSKPLYIGVDVGTGSARAALVTCNGCILSSSEEKINIWEPQPNYFEQSSENIWKSCIAVIRNVVEKVSDKSLIHGIGFAATCSLVVLDRNFAPVTVSPTKKDDQNIIMWMDHRAENEANYINSMQHDVLKYVGGKISLEMQTPKLLWLKKNMKETWSKAEHFFDLSDFLTWRATNSLTRSSCSLVCKWTYQAGADESKGWPDSYFHMIGLNDLTEEKYRRIGNDVQSIGLSCGSGLSKQSSEELGLIEGTPVGPAMIDAHCGGIGCLGCNVIDVQVTEKIALILGTSSCFMAVSKDPVFVPGVWGPYYSAMIPGLWLSEGGQSTTGKLMDHIIETHPSYTVLQEKAKTRQMSTFDYLNNHLEQLGSQCEVAVWELTKDLHIWPDFHGNRSPLADASLRGMISGLTLAHGIDELAVLYLATLQALAYGTKLTIDAMTKAGHQFSVVHACGGITKNSLFVQTTSDVIGLPVVLPTEIASVSLGAAILGACASKDFTSIQEVMRAMGGSGKIVQPQSASEKFHKKKFAVFMKMLDHQRMYREIMATETDMAL